MVVRKPSRDDLLYRVYSAVGYLRAARDVAKRAERKLERAWANLNDSEWLDAGWTKRRIAALNKQRNIEEETRILRRAREIRKRRK